MHGYQHSAHVCDRSLRDRSIAILTRVSFITVSIHPTVNLSEFWKIGTRLFSTRNLFSVDRVKGYQKKKRKRNPTDSLLIFLPTSG